MNKRRNWLPILLVILTGISIFFTACNGKTNTLEIDQGKFSVHYLDVGQGDAILINFPDGKNMLIDTGDDSDAVANYVIECVSKTDASQIDYLVLTHTDTDHIGNAPDIIDAFTIKKAFVPKVTHLEKFQMFSAVLDKLNDQNTEIVISSSSVSLSGEDWFLAFLSPAPPNVFGSSYVDFNSAEIPTSEQINNLSPIIYLDYKGNRFLFTGDAGVSQENYVINNYLSNTYDIMYGAGKVKLENIDFLKVSHHGASDASSEKFLQLLSPRNVVISVGENNYGHPSTAILTRIQMVSPDVNFYRTDVNSTISARFDAQFGIKIDCINVPKKN